MDFGLSEEQELLQRSAREFLERECTAAFVRTVAGDEEGYPRALYRQMAELGWNGLMVPESYGGLGLGFLELALLTEEMGRAALPGPFFSSSVLATIALMEGASAGEKRHWLPRLATGDAVGTVAFLEESDRLDAEGIQARAKKSRTGYRLSGVKMFVTDAHVADFLVAAFRTGSKSEDVSLFLVPKEAPGLTVRSLPNVDGTRRSSEVEFRDVELPSSSLMGGENKGWTTMSKLLDAAAIALAADALGGSERTLEMAVEYSKVREQFGRVIGSFQAVKHMAAEVVSEIEPARSLVWYAAYAYDALPREASRAASMAKARLSDVYTRASNRAVQIHGGIGFTWEHDIHFWFKRAKWNELSFGDPTYHRERLAQLAKF
jgi:alkylation response protein AidB-like acyl-CoA dehydrogenase